MKNFETSGNKDLLKEIIGNDNPGITPNPSIEERLNYYYMLHKQKKKIYSNSFGGIFTWFFSGKNIIMKTGFAMFFISFFIFKTQFINPTDHSLSNRGFNNSQIVDTNFVTKDTCR